MKRPLLVFASAAGLLCLAGSPARASQTQATPIAWSYNFTPSQSFVSADASATNQTPGTVTFTNGLSQSASGNSDVVVTNLRTSSTAPVSSPDTLTSNGAYSVSMTLTDAASGQSSTLTFTGKLGGSFSSVNSNVTNTFTGQTTDTVTLGGNTYTVAMTGYTPPGPPTANNAGSISAHVTVTSNLGSGTGASTPEPSTLVLSCLGLTLAGAASWRKRRRTLASVLA
jgi:hypothetical protein